jgi:hypothetical protein
VRRVQRRAPRRNAALAIAPRRWRKLTSVAEVLTSSQVPSVPRGELKTLELKAAEISAAVY